MEMRIGGERGGGHGMAGQDETAGSSGSGSGRQCVLVLPDRDAAEEVATAAAERFPLLGEPRLVRDALAGEDDAEDAQWLVVLDGDLDGRALRSLDELAAGYDGWRELD